VALDWQLVALIVILGAALALERWRGRDHANARPGNAADTAAGRAGAPGAAATGDVTAG
jgi:hypothetical protein